MALMGGLQSHSPTRAVARGAMQSILLAAADGADGGAAVPRQPSTCRGAGHCVGLLLAAADGADVDAGASDAAKQQPSTSHGAGRKRVLLLAAADDTDGGAAVPQQPSTCRGAGHCVGLLLTAADGADGGAAVRQQPSTCRGAGTVIALTGGLQSHGSPARAVARGTGQGILLAAADGADGGAVVPQQPSTCRGAGTVQDSCSLLPMALMGGLQSDGSLARVVARAQ